jgi:uncharacterized membrane protein YgdD (TMEM256/DUF423 family)
MRALASTPAIDRQARIFLLIGAVSAALAVAAGAFGAHGLRATVTPDRLAAFETAARYQMYHALALLAVGLLASRLSPVITRLAGWLFVAGTGLFAGSLYMLVLTDTPALGIITPFGGVAFMAGWVALAVGIARSGHG